MREVANFLFEYSSLLQLSSLSLSRCRNFGINAARAPGERSTEVLACAGRDDRALRVAVSELTTG